MGSYGLVGDVLDSVLVFFCNGVVWLDIDGFVVVFVWLLF